MLYFSKGNNGLSRILILALFFIISLNNSFSQSQVKKTLEVKDYEKWENLGYSSTFSDDGNWFLYDIRRNNKKNEIRLHNLSDISLKVLPQGLRPQFTNDSQWLGYFISPTPEEREKSKTPLRNKFALLNLSNGDSLVIENVSAFNFSHDSKYLAMKRFASKEKESKGSDLVIRNLKTSQEHNFGNVAEYAWMDESSMIAMVIDADGKAGNGIQLFNPETGVLKVLDSEEAVYSGLRWREDNDDLAVFRSFENELYEGESQHVLVWKDLISKKPIKTVLDQNTIQGFPEDHKIINSRSLIWSDNGEQLYLAIKAWEPKPEESEKDEEKEKDSFQDFTDEAPALQIWHSKDVKVIPEQELSASRRRDNQYVSVWHIAKNQFVQLEDDLVESIRIQTDVNTLIGTDATPYERDGMFGRPSADIYTVDIMTGVKAKALTKTSTTSSVGPNEKYFAYIKDGDYYLYDIKQKSHKRLT